MNSARHEGGHAAALHLLGLGDVLRPAGAAISPGGGGILDLTPGATDPATLTARAVDVPNEPCGLVVRTANEYPHLAPAIITFLCAGFAATAGEWQGRFWPSVNVRMSGDLEAIRMIISDLLNTSDYLANNFVSEWGYECLMRAVEWCERPEVARLIDAAAAHLEAHTAASWGELETIFSALTVTASPGRDVQVVDVPASPVLADGAAGASGGLRPRRG